MTIKTNKTALYTIDNLLYPYGDYVKGVVYNVNYNDRPIINLYDKNNKITTTTLARYIMATSLGRLLKQNETVWVRDSNLPVILSNLVLKTSSIELDPVTIDKIVRKVFKYINPHNGDELAQVIMNKKEVLYLTLPEYRKLLNKTKQTTLRLV